MDEKLDNVDIWMNLFEIKLPLLAIQDLCTITLTNQLERVYVQ